jgi:reactive chlorine resistance protein C
MKICMSSGLNRKWERKSKRMKIPAGLPVEGKAVVRSIDKISAFVLRYGLVLVVFWIGCLKFTAYESKGVFNHASHSPLLAWAYHILDVRDFSRGLGVVEITIALLIAIGPVWPKLSIVGSIAGIGMFLTTLSFVITTPGVWQAGYGFPALAASPGQFLVKDVVLLGAAIWTLADSLRYVADGNGSTLQKPRKFDDVKGVKSA